MNFTFLNRRKYFDSSRVPRSNSIKQKLWFSEKVSWSSKNCIISQDFVMLKIFLESQQSQHSRISFQVSKVIWKVPFFQPLKKYLKKNELRLTHTSTSISTFTPWHSGIYPVKIFIL